MQRRLPGGSTDCRLEGGAASGLLLDDYRLMVMRHFCTAMWGWSVRQNSGIWWNHLERITLAMQDLHCLELL